MSFSYSKVSTYCACPYKYKLVYIDKIAAKPDTSASNALFLGTAIHEGIEKRDIQSAIDSYKANFESTSEEHDLEILKIKTVLQKAIESIPHGEYEYKLSGDDGFIGFIDCLVKVEEGVYDILDFKYSNNVAGYLKSPQISLYKYYFEKLTGFKVRRICYVFIPKYKPGKNMKQDEIKADILENYSKLDVRIEEVQYDQDQVDIFINKRKLMEMAKVFEKKRGFDCRWCDFQKYCNSCGKDLSELTPESIAKIRGEVIEEHLF